MVPGVIICILPGSLTAESIKLLAERGITTVYAGDYEPQTPKTEDLARRLLDVQAKQIGEGARKETRPPWIRQATGRAPRHLGPKGARR